MTGQVGDTCAKCGGTLIRRKDDEPEAIRKRLEVFEQQTAPVFDWYTRSGTRVVVIDAAGPVDEVTARALKALRP
jgi:adenylate kinase